MRNVMILVFSLYASSVLAGQDARVLVEMPAPMREHMLSNMRDHVATLNEMLMGLAKKDYDRAAQAAEQRLGISSLTTHGAEHMAPYMPKPMQAIGTEMHRAATRFALAAQERDLDMALTELTAVTSQCVACHSAYRVQ
jgi:cytochrome c556